MPRKGSTVENRVYLFRDLASAWLSAHGSLLASDRQAAMAALADIAYVSCVVADTENDTPERVADCVQSRPRQDAGSGRQRNRTATGSKKTSRRGAR